MRLTALVVLERIWQATFAALADSRAAGAMSVSEIFVELQGFLAAEQDIREVSSPSLSPVFA